MEGQDGVPRVVLIVKQGPELAVRETFFETGQGGLDLGPDVLPLGQELRQDLDLVLLLPDPGEKLDVAFEPLFLLLEGLGGLLVLPDLRGGEAQVQGIAFGFFVIEVKENPAALRTCRMCRRGAF
jgi:hypothetical protein